MRHKTAKTDPGIGIMDPRNQKQTIKPAATKKKRLLSFIFPVMNESGNLDELYQEVKKVLDQRPDDYEMIFVDDGSTDATPDVLKGEAATCPELVMVRHGATAGQSAAIRTGVKSARAPVIVTLDGDGQND